MELPLHMHSQKQTVTQESQRTSSLSSMTNHSCWPPGQSKWKESYHLPYERLRLVQRLLRYPCSFTPNWCSCNKNNTSHNDREAEQGVHDQCAWLKEYSTEAETAAPSTSMKSWRTSFNKMNAHLAAYRLSLEMERQDKSRNTKRNVCSDKNECGVQVSSTHINTLRHNKNCYSESEQELELQEEEEEKSTYQNANLINIISPLSESSLRKSKWESFKEGEDGRPITAMGHVPRKIHSTPSPLTHHTENTTHKDNSNTSNNSDITDVKQTCELTSHNNDKVEPSDNAGKTDLIHKCRVAGTTLADYMWCHVQEKNNGDNNSVSKSKTKDKLRAQKSSTSYSTEMDLTSAEEILKSENEHDDVYLYVNNCNSSIKAAEHHSQSSENEPFISLNLPELKHCINTITPSITTLTNNTDDDTEIDTTPTRKQLFSISNDKSENHALNMVNSVRDRQLGDNAISTFSLTSRPQTPSTQRIQDGKESHEGKAELLCVEPIEEYLRNEEYCVNEWQLKQEQKKEELQEEESHEKVITQELTVSQKEHANCTSNDNNNAINLVNTFVQSNEVAPVDRKESMLTTPNIQTPSNSMVPLCSPPACDSTGVRETSPEEDIVLSDHDVRIKIADSTMPCNTLQGKLELLWNEKNDDKDETIITGNKHEKDQNTVSQHYYNNNNLSINKIKEQCEEKQDTSANVANAALNKKTYLQHSNNKNSKYNCKNVLVMPQLHNSTLNVASSSTTDTRCFVQPTETNSMWTSDTDSCTNRPEHSITIPSSPPLTPITNAFTESELLQLPAQIKTNEQPQLIKKELYRNGIALRWVNSSHTSQTSNHGSSNSMITKLHIWAKTLHGDNNHNTINGANNNKQNNEENELTQSQPTLLTVANVKCEVCKRSASCLNSNCNQHYQHHYHRNRLLFSRLPSKFHTIELKSEHLRLNAFKYNYVK